MHRWGRKEAHILHFRVKNAMDACRNLTEPFVRQAIRVCRNSSYEQAMCMLQAAVNEAAALQPLSHWIGRERERARGPFVGKHMSE